MKDILIKTPRLVLRPPTLEDAKDITRAKQEVWDQLQLWMNFAYDGEETHEATLKYLDITFSDLKNGYPHLLARHRKTGEFVCLTGATNCPDIDGGFATGYWVSKAYLGQGYATEATNAAIRYAFNALHAREMHISYFDDNEKSKRIIEKLGFEFLKTDQGAHARCLDGKPMDEHNYVMRDPSVLPDLDVRWEP